MSQQLKFKPQGKGVKMGAACSDEQEPTEMTQPTETSDSEDEMFGESERSDEWRSDLLKDVDKIFMGKYPGRMVVFGKSAEPVMTIGDVTNTIVAAASHGRGRIVVFSHESLTKDFIKNRANNRQFFNNIVKWTTKSADQNPDVKVIDIDKITEFKDVRAQLGDEEAVIAWTGSTPRSERFIRKLRRWIRKGGAFVCGLTPWAWARRGKTLTQIPIFQLLQKVGILYTMATLRPPLEDDHVKVVDNIADQCHVRYLIEACKSSEEGLNEHGVNLARMPDVSEILVDHVRDDFLEIIQKYEEKINYVPTRDTPVGTDKEKALMYLYNALLYAGYTNNKVGPACDIFPGIIPEADINPTTKSIKIASNSFVDFYFTGLYLPPGKEIRFKINEGANATSKWRMIIGAHTDKMSINYSKPLRRWPVLKIKQFLDEDDIKIYHPFGGLVFFMSPAEKGNTLSVDVYNVIQTPVFDMRKENYMQVWKYTRDAPGLWAEFSGHHITFIYPSTTVRGIDDPTPIMEYWDTALKHIYYIRGRSLEEQRRQVIVFDEQPSIGLLHSGYPIVGQLRGQLGEDGKLPKNLSLEQLEERVPWGPFHEMGHNMQNKMWTFDGTKEVTCNIFAMYAQQMMTGENAWDIVMNWDEKRLRKVHQHFGKGGATYANWKKNPFLGLVIYMQLARDFGWSSYAKIFRKYDSLAMSQKPKTNNDRIDLWMTTFSKLVRYNLTPLFEFWGLPLRDAAKTSVSDLPAYFPDDEITKTYGPNQAEAILEKYPDAVREPSAVPSIEVAVEQLFTATYEMMSLDSDGPEDENENETGCEGHDEF